MCIGIGYLLKDVIDAKTSEQKAVAVELQTELSAQEKEETVSKSPEPNRFKRPKRMTPVINGGYVYDFDPVITLKDEFIDSLKELIREGDYDQAIEKATARLKCYDSFWEERKADEAILMRDTIHLLAVALELKGDHNGAFSVNSLLNSRRSDLFEWFNIRMSYQNGQTELAFTRICSLIARNYVFYPIDNLLNADAERAASIKKRSANPIDYPNHIPFYQLRDQCLQVVNPKLHYALDNARAWDERYFGKLDREALETFKNFMETEYQKHIDKSGEVVEGRYSQAMDFVRKLCELP